MSLLTPKFHRKDLHHTKTSVQSSLPADFYDARNSFARVSTSLFTFVVVECGMEVAYEFFPGGMVFPVGFLLFWAFYYTFYRPTTLENTLALPTRFDFMRVARLILGVVAWFIKGTLVELGQFFFWRKIDKRPRVEKFQSSIPLRHRRMAGPTQPTQKPNLPPEVVEALAQLGLKPGCTWKQVHKRYRELAKQLHPDLNRGNTDFGHRFMRVDAAYHRLEKTKNKHF